MSQTFYQKKLIRGNKALDEGKVRYSKVQGEEESINNIIDSINNKSHFNVSAESILGVMVASKACIKFSTIWPF